MKAIAVFAVMLALIAPSARSEPQPAVLALMPYMDGVAPCLEAADHVEIAKNCVGQGAEICMEREPDGYTTVGMMFCVLAENEAWDRVLNSEYADRMERMRELDAQEAQSFPEFAVRADRLRDAQRAWIVFRDAHCRLEYAIWGAGSMRQTAGAGCHMHETADRAIYLRFLSNYM